MLDEFRHVLQSVISGLQPVLIQLQHQNLHNGQRGFVGQLEVNTSVSLDDLLKWGADLQSRHPLPEEPGWTWRIVDESSDRFFFAAGPGTPIEDEGGRQVGEVRG